jgi:DNA polymerase III alpha subunit (gram-positive type)
MYLFLDVETTGLIDEYETDPAMIPRIVTISWLVYNKSRERIDEKNYLIRCDGFRIPEDATNIHGITTEYSLENGVDLLPVLCELKQTIDDNKYTIAHNAEYDLLIIKGEFYRQKIKFNLKKLNKICTMLSSIEYCKLPSCYNNEYKYPKLSELYIKITGNEIINAHRSSTDTAVCAECFFYLLKRKIIKLDKHKSKK